MFSVKVMNQFSIRWAEFVGIRLIESALLLALIGIIFLVFRRKIKTEYMWWKGNNQSSSTREVGLKKPNPWGLYDLHGNVSEWCSDRWEKPKDRGPQTDPLGPMKSFRLFPFLTNRVFRGGGFSYDAPECTSASRRYEQSIDYHYTIGFRLVLEVSDGN